jgi:hypothetical protein
MDESASRIDLVNTPFRRAVERLFRCGVIGRALAAAYIRSIDPGAAGIQQIASLLHLRKVEQQTREFRLWWRQQFETKVCTLAEVRVRDYIDQVVRFHRAAGCRLPPLPHDVFWSRLVEDLENDSVLLAHAAELQKLPVGDAALELRLRSLDRAVEIHMAVLADEVLTEATVGGRG